MKQLAGTKQLSAVAGGEVRVAGAENFQQNLNISFGAAISKTSASNRQVFRLKVIPLIRPTEDL